MHPDAYKRAAAAESQEAPPPRRPALDLRRAWLSRGLVIACIGLFVIEVGLTYAQRGPGALQGLIFGWRGQFWPLFGPWVAEGRWWLIFGSILEHGGIIHLFFNLSLVWNLGRVYEVSIGTPKFAQISLASALGASFLVLLLAFDQPTVGASGMLLGWLGAMLPIATQAHRRELVIGLVQIAIISMLDFVSWQGHLGGFLAGLPAGLLLRFGPTWFRYGMPAWITVMAIANVWVVLRVMP